ncbi:MAG: hypothetical protein WAN87_00145 [Thermoplasmata archaeon]
MRKTIAAEWRGRGCGLQRLRQIPEVRRLDSRDIELEDFRDLIRVGLLQVPEEPLDALGDRFEENHDLLRGFPRIAPPIMRFDRPVARAGGEAVVEDFLDPSLRDFPIRKRDDHEPHRPGRIERIGRHPTVPPT